MNITCISDLHGHKPDLPGGDLLILGGDYTAIDTILEWDLFFDWIESLPYEKKVMIAGNHDGKLYKNILQRRLPSCITYLFDSGVEWKGVKIWGTPWSRTFKGINPLCDFFTYADEAWFDERLDLIPDDTDILISHSPPFGILDSIKKNKQSIHVGSLALREHVIKRIKPSYHIFGHIHEWGGGTFDCCTSKFFNASILDEKYEFNNKILSFEFN